MYSVIVGLFKMPFLFILGQSEWFNSDIWP